MIAVVAADPVVLTMYMVVEIIYNKDLSDQAYKKKSGVYRLGLHLVPTF